MPESSIILPPNNQKQRTFLKGAMGHDSYVIPTSTRKTSCIWMFSTFRIAGLATPNHNLCYVQNASSATLVAVRRLTIQVDANTALTTLAPAAVSYKINAGGTLPTGGTASTKHLWDSNTTSNVNVTAVGASSAEGTASAITWTAPGGTGLYRQVCMRMASLAGSIVYDDNPLIPSLAQDEPIILRNTEALAVQINIAYATTAHYVIQGVVEEFTLP